MEENDERDSAIWPHAYAGPWRWDEELKSYIPPWQINMRWHRRDQEKAKESDSDGDS